MNALVCSTRMPEYDRECGSRRVFDLVQMLRDAGWQVSYVARDGDVTDRYARMLQQNGVAAYAGFDTLSDEFLARGAFDLALLEYWHVAEWCLPRLRRWSPGTRVVVDSHDVHFLRNTRAAFRAGPAAGSTLVLNAAVGEEFVRELNAYAAADAVLAVSRKEAAVIADLINDSGAVCCVPLCEDLPYSSRPFAERRGMLFVGNFWHQPNADAASYLVNDILPHLHPALLAEHPLWIVGNASDSKAAAHARHPHVRVVGWVPSLTPYLNQVRVSAVPLRYGAGTKGKLTQSLAAGTPVVSTSIGVEGLALEHRHDLLIADEPAAFAAALEVLLTNEEQWMRLAARGPDAVRTVHGPDVVRRCFISTIGDVVRQQPKRRMDGDSVPQTSYEEIRARTVDAVRRMVPEHARIAIISKGDERLLAIPQRQVEHFPRLPDGRYAGFYPADGAAALAVLQSAVVQGVEFLVVPKPSAWWLEHYIELADHLRGHATVMFQDESTTIYSLGATDVSPATKVHSTPPPPAPRRERRQRPEAFDVERHRPQIHARIGAADGTDSPRVLVLGIYLPGSMNNAVDESRVLRASRHCVVDERWVALGGAPVDALADVTVASIPSKTPKFEILNRLVGIEDMDRYDYLVLMDDDIVLPHGFLDAFIGLQRRLDFALAQPARTSDSYLDHPIVEQQRGVVARQTMFVEIGPVTSIHRSLYDALLPFDLTSPMGWGYENIWAHHVRARELRMGIVDAVPVSHSMRKPVANYSWEVADAERHALLAARPHLELDECFRVLDVIEFQEARHG